MIQFNLKFFSLKASDSQFWHLLQQKFRDGDEHKKRQQWSGMIFPDTALAEPYNTVMHVWNTMNKSVIYFHKYTPFIFEEKNTQMQ